MVWSSNKSISCISFQQRTKRTIESLRTYDQRKRSLFVSSDWPTCIWYFYLFLQQSHRAANIDLVLSEQEHNLTDGPIWYILTFDIHAAV
jgi:hypothetical protein